jgi:3-hydroxyisobutyrate dehydrogenase
VNKLDIKETIGWIGTGVMGLSMCRHLQKKGLKLNIFNRTKDKAKTLIEAGAQWCEDPAEVAKKSDIIFTIVGYPKDVEEVYFGQKGILSTLEKGKTIIDMTTSNPAIAERIYNAAEEIGAKSLDSPVSGGDTGAKNGTLAIMVGGDKQVFEEIFPILDIFGKNIKYLGKAGAGQHTKMSNQIHIASTMIGVVESLIYAYKAGLNLDEVIDIIGTGAAASWSLNNLGRRIVKKNFQPGFFLKHFVKDMKIALDEAKRMKLSLPGLSLAYEFYYSAMAQGWENLGTQGLYKVFALMNNIKI